MEKPGNMSTYDRIRLIVSVNCEVYFDARFRKYINAPLDMTFCSYAEDFL